MGEVWNNAENNYMSIQYGTVELEKDVCLSAVVNDDDKGSKTMRTHPTAECLFNGCVAVEHK